MNRETGGGVEGHFAISEVVRLHQFFQRWLGGVDVGAQDWADFEASLDPQFDMIVPSGHRIGRAELLTSFRPAFRAKPGLEIEIRNAQVIRTIDDSVLVRYEEWQESLDASTSRVSTALLQQSRTAPAGWIWLTLQETWLPGR